MTQTLVISVSLAIVVSALCSICEAVLYSLTPSQVEMLKRSHEKSGFILHHLRADIENPITAILTLNTIANTVGAAIAGAAAANLFGDQNVYLFSAALTLAILIFSEIIPKTVGVSFSYRLAPVIAGPLQFTVIVLKPIVLLCRFVTRLIPTGKNDDTVSAEEIQTIAALSRESGHIEEAQEKVISNILELKQKTVRQVMTPRTVTFSLEEQKTVREAMEQIDVLTSHSRVPVYDGDFDNVTGMIMRKDVLLAAAAQKFEAQLKTLKNDVHFVAETMPLNRVLIDFFEKRQHLFVVVDEYGAVTGVISMEDVLEEIVGEEIIDESDRTLDMRALARQKSIDIQP
ncbi:MAG: hemolysin family protein [Desulfocapsaceae bacterium]|jgi:CBS domain containing-hemolysin-like protein|nr:hemolysin family protein [Desulfocapsaceae bacterium]